MLRKVSESAAGVCVFSSCYEYFILECYGFREVSKRGFVRRDWGVIKANWLVLQETKVSAVIAI